MRTASKPSLQALSQAILQSNKVNLTFHHHARTSHGSAHLGSTSVCYASDKKSMPYSSLEASGGQPPRIWQCRQHRYFSSLIGKHGNSVFISRNSSASIVSPDAISHDNKNENNSFNSHAPDINENHSLHSNVHYIIHKIQVGTMKNDNLGKARSFLSIVSKWNNEKGALLAEALLERLYKERFVGKNIDAVVDTEVYNICLDAWNKSNANGDTIIEKAELLTKVIDYRIHRSWRSMIVHTRHIHHYYKLIPIILSLFLSPLSTIIL